MTTPLEQRIDELMAIGLTNNFLITHLYLSIQDRTLAKTIVRNSNKSSMDWLLGQPISDTTIDRVQQHFDCLLNQLVNETATAQEHGRV